MRPDLMQYATPVLDRPVMLHMSLTINRDCGCTCFIQSGITVGISARFLTPPPPLTESRSPAPTADRCG